MKEYLLKNNNKIIVDIGKIEEQIGDALLCWTAIDLHSGPDSFYNIHKKAGTQVRYSFLFLEPHVKEGSCFTSIPGLTNFYTILHSVLPFTPTLFNDSFFNIVKTLKKYKESNVCRDLYLTFPTVNKKLIVDNLLLYIQQLENFSFIFICDTEIDYAQSVKVLDKKLKLSWWQKLTGNYH